MRHGRRHNFCATAHTENGYHVSDQENARGKHTAHSESDLSPYHRFARCVLAILSPTHERQCRSKHHTCPRRDYRDRHRFAKKVVYPARLALSTPIHFFSNCRLVSQKFLMVSQPRSRCKVDISHQTDFFGEAWYLKSNPRPYTPLEK